MPGIKNATGKTEELKPTKPRKPRQEQPASLPKNVKREDFYAYMPAHNYIYVPTRQHWPAASVNARLPPQVLLDGDGQPVRHEGKIKYIPASTWLDKNRHVEDLTWVPGKPMVLESTLVMEGGFIHSAGSNSFNTYREPLLQSGNASKAKPWLEHCHKVFGEYAEHMILWFAHRVQKPWEKINHALVMGGAQGIGKDTIIEPVKRAVGQWNFKEVSPKHLVSDFTGFVKAIILRINEAHDLGDIRRTDFYEHTKEFIAAPPDVLDCNLKHQQPYCVVNVMGVILTTNHKTAGIFLPADDRRHFVMWSNLCKESFPPDYWNRIWAYYDKEDGDKHVAAYLRGLDLSKFDPKAPPPQTSAWHDIVDANCRPEDFELADAIDILGHPKAITTEMVKAVATDKLRSWLDDGRNARSIPYRFEQCEYVAIRNSMNGKAVNKGRWIIDGTRQMVYAQRTLDPRDQYVAAMTLVEGAAGTKHMNGAGSDDGEMPF